MLGNIARKWVKLPPQSIYFIIGIVVSVGIGAPAIFYASYLSKPQNIEIELSAVNTSSSMRSSTDQDSSSLQVIFTIRNVLDVSAFPSKLEYELFANGKSIGNDIVSPGADFLHEHAARIAPGQSVELTDILELKRNERNSSIFGQILDNDNMSEIHWSVNGTAFISVDREIRIHQFSHAL